MDPTTHRRIPPLIYLGPSLSHTEAEAICPGEYRPPVARGDLAKDAGAQARRIVIIDGQFLQSRSVSPKEILAALDQGHRVYGAASIGALRAVELEHFGMQGVGWIFEAYRSEAITADDEVAVAFDQDTLRPLSVPLVNVRVALREAFEAGLLSRREIERLIEAARSLYYPARAYSQIVRMADLPARRQDRLLDFLNHQATDQKAEDAKAVLRIAARDPQTGKKSNGGPPAIPLRPAAERKFPPLSELPHAPKIGGRDSVRTFALQDTLGRLAQVRSQVGITRVTDIEGLDYLGVPNYVAVRPSRHPWCNSVYSGKGLTAEDARIGAQMEALEMACALEARRPELTASFTELQRSGCRALDPDALIPRYRAPQNLKDVHLEWVAGWDIESGEDVLAPMDAVFFRSDDRPTYWKISSNGLASGNTLSEALAHGLAEVIERDAETMFRLATEYSQFPGMLRIVAGKGRAARPDHAPPPPRSFPMVRLESLPDPLPRLVDQICSTGVQVAVRCITSDVNVPTFLCALYEPTGDQRKQLVHYGCGAHPDAYISVRRAITEAAQSRVTAIQGAREDLGAGALAPSEPPLEWFRRSPDAIDFNCIPGAHHADIRADIQEMLARLSQAGLSEAVAVDIGSPAFEFAVVKVIVPGLELAFHSRVQPDDVTFGWRARRYFESV